MTYSTKILPEGDKYVGYALLNGEVVSTTKPCNTAQQASFELEKFTKGNTPTTEMPNVRVNRVETTPFSTQLTRLQSSVIPASSVRRCCGRG